MSNLVIVPEKTQQLVKELGKGFEPLINPG